MIEIGTYKRKKVYKSTISNGIISADIINYGAILTSLRVKKDNEIVDVVLGYDTLEEYIKDTSAFGRTIGRVCNRIKDAKFVLNGITYNLPQNKGTNCLHGGNNGVSYKIWDIDKVSNDSVSLSCFSPDGEEGFPGNLTLQTTYSITKDNGLKIEFSGHSDQDTIIAMTNHSYFNLNGHGSGDILSHKLIINSNLYTPVDDSSCPFNSFESVKETPFDFTDYKQIGKDIRGNNDQLKICGGYDINYMWNGDLYKPFVSVVGDKTGLKMDVYTDQKGVQVYTANFLTKRVGKGKIYDKRHGVCIETQNPPNAINCNNYPSPIIKKGEKYSAITEYRFNV